VVDVSINTSSAGTVDKLLIEEITPGASGPVTLLDSLVKQANFGITYKYTVPQGASGKRDIRVTATDNLGQQSVETKTITITSGAIADCDNETLGSHKSTIGSFFATKSCNVYTVGEAKANKSAVDFIYFYGQTNQATLAAPDDADVNTLGEFQLVDWTAGEKNATRFKAISAFDFDNATAATLTAAWTTAVGAEMTKANMLSNSQMVAFKTADGRYGVVRVNSITAGDDGTINIDVKSTM
jgi:hypothetical protein